MDLPNGFGGFWTEIIVAMLSVKQEYVHVRSRPFDNVPVTGQEARNQQVNGIADGDVPDRVGFNMCDTKGPAMAAAPFLVQSFITQILLKVRSQFVYCVADFL